MTMGGAGLRDRVVKRMPRPATGTATGQTAAAISSRYISTATATTIQPSPARPSLQTIEIFAAVASSKEMPSLVSYVVVALPRPRRRDDESIFNVPAYDYIFLKPPSSVNT